MCAMPYELNPLLRDELQKKSPVTPSDIQRIESEISELKNNLGNLNQKKITKFYSAMDFLDNGEVAEYQGNYVDSDNNLIPNYFYQKNPELTINITSTQEYLSMLNFFAYDFLNNQLLAHKFTADRTLTENIFITGNLDNSDNETVGLFLIAANTTNQFGTRWNTLSDNRRIAPFAFFVENNSIVARYVDIDYNGSNFFIDGEEFYFKNQTTGNYSQISFALNNCFYYWIYCTLNRIPFYFPVACASSDYSTADLIFVSEIPLIASRLRFVQPSVLVPYYDYTASINQDLFTRVNTQPPGVTPEEAQELVSNRVINAGGVATIIALTQAAYDAITTKDANTMYVITD